MTPIKPIASVTESPAVSTMPVASTCIGDSASTAPEVQPEDADGAQVI